MKTVSRARPSQSAVNLAAASMLLLLVFASQCTHRDRSPSPATAPPAFSLQTLLNVDSPTPWVVDATVVSLFAHNWANVPILSLRGYPNTRATIVLPASTNGALLDRCMGNGVPTTGRSFRLSLVPYPRPYPEYGPYATHVTTQEGREPRRFWSVVGCEATSNARATR